jgi:hypothetical protein
MSVPLAPTPAPHPWCLHPGERDGRKPLNEATAPVSPYGSTERMPSFEDTARMPSFEDIAPEPGNAAPTPVSGEDITQPIRVNRARVPMARA